MAAKKLLKLSRKLLGRIANQRKLKALSVLMVLLAGFTVFQLYQDYIKAIETADYYKKQNLTYKSKYYNLSDNYRSLSEQNPEVNIVKTIDGQKYALQRDPLSHIFKFGLYNEGKIEDIETASDFSRLGELLARTADSTTQDFWIDEASNQFFLIDKRDNHEIILSRSIILEEADGSTIIRDPLTIVSTKLTSWYSQSRIQEYFPAKKQLLINTAGGDGCGGEGEWWLLNINGEVESIVKYTGGCNIENYRFGRRIGSNLVIADVQNAQGLSKSGYTDFGYITKLYSVDIFSKTITSLPFNPSEGEYFDLVNSQWYESDHAAIKPALSDSEVILTKLGEGYNTNYYAYNFETEEMRPVSIGSN